MVSAFNATCLGILNKPIVRCVAEHHGRGAKVATSEDAGGLEREILLAEGASIMIT
jgi:hypothetical protein